MIEEANITTHSNNEGKYTILVKPGKYTIKVFASGYQSNVKYIEVNSANVYPKLVMFTMVEDKNVLGLPRMAFIIITGDDKYCSNIIRKTFSNYRDYWCWSCRRMCSLCDVLQTRQRGIWITVPK